MGDVFGDAAVGAVFGELLRAVLQETNRAIGFKGELKKLESTLQYAIPFVKQIQNFNELLGRSEEETKNLTELMEKGKQLVRKCSKVCWLRRGRYAAKIIELDGSIRRYFGLDNQLQMVRDGQEILFLTREVYTMCKRSRGIVKNGGAFDGSGGVIGACSVPDPPAITPGLDVPLEELKMDLFSNDGKQVIVVSAPGGYGKTTLVKKLCKGDQVQGKFRNIFFVTVSKTPNVKVIVQRIFEHKNKKQQFQTDEEALNDLERLLREVGQEATLLILDDVWSGSESLLDMFMFQLPNYKILVTTRSKFPQFGPPHCLESLNDEDAATLFHHTAILSDGNSYIPEENLVKEILSACKGCPLALTVVGASLRGQAESIWQRRAKDWSQSASILDSNSEVLNCLQRSLDALNDEMKECYMDLCSFLEGQRIPIAALFDMWTELYEPAEDDLFANSNLHELSNRNLLKLVTTRQYTISTFIPQEFESFLSNQILSTSRNNARDDGCYNDDFVLQHDLFKELTACLSKLPPIEQRKRLIIEIDKNYFPDWWLEQKQHPNNAHLLSISTDESFSSNWCNLHAPEVKVVVLNILTEKYTLPNFLENMDKMKALIITNYGFFPTELTNFPLLGSLSKLRRIRLEHVSVPSFGMMKVQMKNLQKISLVMCNVSQAFQDSAFQISDAFPNLLEINIDYCNDLIEFPDGLCGIVSIRKLSITNCHKLSALPEAIGKLVKLEMLKLASCVDLSALPDTIGNLSNLCSLDISECLSIRELPEQIGELCSLKTLFMRGCSSCELPTSVANLKNLAVVKCDEETAYRWKSSPFCPTKVDIQVVQEDADLNWLQNPHF